MAGRLTREWHKGNRRVEEVAFLAPRALTVPTGLKIGGNPTFGLTSICFHQLMSPLTTRAPTSAASRMGWVRASKFKLCSRFEKRDRRPLSMLLLQWFWCKAWKERCSDICLIVYKTF